MDIFNRQKKMSGTCCICAKPLGKDCVATFTNNLCDHIAHNIHLSCGLQDEDEIVYACEHMKKPSCDECENS